jgi:hypothetical protein
LPDGCHQWNGQGSQLEFSAQEVIMLHYVIHLMKIGGLFHEMSVIHPDLGFLWFEQKWKPGRALLFSFILVSLKKFAKSHWRDPFSDTLTASAGRILLEVQLHRRGRIARRLAPR